MRTGNRTQFFDPAQHKSELRGGCFGRKTATNEPARLWPHFLSATNGHGRMAATYPICAQDNLEQSWEKLKTNWAAGPNSGSCLGTFRKGLEQLRAICSPICNQDNVT